MTQRRAATDEHDSGEQCEFQAGDEGRRVQVRNPRCAIDCESGGAQTEIGPACAARAELNSAHAERENHEDYARTAGDILSHRERDGDVHRRLRVAVAAGEHPMIFGTSNITSRPAP